MINLPVTDEFGEEIIPGDRITYWSKQKKKWTDGEVAEYRWNEQGVVMKVRLYWKRSDGSRMYESTTILRKFDGVRKQQ